MHAYIVEGATLPGGRTSRSTSESFSRIFLGLHLHRSNHQDRQKLSDRRIVSLQIRTTFARMLVTLAVLSRSDDGSSVEDSILDHVLRLIKREPVDNVKLPPQYFLFFNTYAANGRYEVKRRAADVWSSALDILLSVALV